ncbi:MAG: hypothetical protein ACOYYI_17100, partial [Chloroflexota bacterium]
IIIGLLINILFLTACGQTTIVTPTALVHPVEQAPSTPSPTPTRTLVPSATPTASITPLPTIPTFTPTFDVSTIVTVTPAPQAECPKENPKAKLDTSFFQEYPEKSSDNQIQQAVLDFINSGGSRQVANFELQKNNKYGYPYGSTANTDLTNDGVTEFIVEIGAGFRIYTCRNGLYETSLDFYGGVGESASIVEIKDMNLNGIPEIVAGITTCSGHCFDISIKEWNGNEFQNLLGEWQTITASEEKVMDTNNDGVLELVISGPFPSMGSYELFIPMRRQTDIYAWNGTSFSFSRPKLSPPTYRFQAIQDGDTEILDGNFDKALLLYKEAIFGKELQWWSKDRREHEVKLYLDIWDSTKPTPPPEPPEDLTEYPRLAAYAYYRIMLLHLVQGQDTEASTTYNTLQQKFGDDPYARPYVDMATAFWEAYQSTRKMYDGCAAAIQYAVEHPEILIPLGSDYHGSQARIYKPEDVCPFR